MKTFDDDSVDLIITSPPYADSRLKTYGGIAADEYVDWFLPISDEMLRVLKPTGSFVLNIKERFHFLPYKILKSIVPTKRFTLLRPLPNFPPVPQLMLRRLWRRQNE